MKILEFHDAISTETSLEITRLSPKLFTVYPDFARAFKTRKSSDTSTTSAWSPTTPLENMSFYPETYNSSNSINFLPEIGSKSDPTGVSKSAIPPAPVAHLTTAFKSSLKMKEFVGYGSLNSKEKLSLKDVKINTEFALLQLIE